MVDRSVAENSYRAQSDLCFAPQPIAELRRFFEVDRHYVAIAALKALADDAKIDMRTVTDAMQSFGIDPDKPNPMSV